jgi:hypothetical protein
MIEEEENKIETIDSIEKSRKVIKRDISKFKDYLFDVINNKDEKLNSTLTEKDIVNAMEYICLEGRLFEKREFLNFIDNPEIIGIFLHLKKRYFKTFNENYNTYYIISI